MQRKYCGKLTKKDLGTNIKVNGWVDTVRDHGQLLFIHLRDISGIIQIVFDPEKNAELYNIAQTIRSEFVLEIRGNVVERSEENKNPLLPTGNIEIACEELVIINKSKTPPFIVSEKAIAEGESEESNFNVDEDLRLKYRYLDLRRPSMRENMVKRSQFNKTIRNYLDTVNFIEVETPNLTKSTPEGARDYLVPSRHHQGKFYALPQSPQLFKQLLMVGGLDRYYQIARCFRDEDLRPNRQPEFTQLDMELSFVDEEDIYALMEGLLKDVFKVEGIDLPTPFPRITYEDSIKKYGNDHPDMRFEMEMVDVTEILKEANYKIINTIIGKGGKVKGINIKGQAPYLSKNVLQEEIAKKEIQKLGGKGLTWMKYEEGQLQSNIVQFFTEEEKQNLIKAMGAEEGDVLAFVADTNIKAVDEVLGRFRVYIAERQKMIPQNIFKPVWVTDFPLFEQIDGKSSSLHHPFTAPQLGEENLTEAKSRAYDVVINGEEVGGGSIRIHQADIQQKVFDTLGLSKEDIKEKFGFFVEALQYGTPIHGGIALGLDRLYAMILAAPSIREVIAFPKNRTAYCPMTQAPSTVSKGQLSDLSLRIQEDLS